MEEIGKPVKKFDQLKKAVQEMDAKNARLELDLLDTAIAFADKSDKELKKAAWLFGLMNKHWLVGIGSKLGVAAIKLHLPFIETVVKNTIYEQFCGGTTLLECQKSIDRLARQNTLSILDYGAEAKETEEDFNQTMNETIRAIEFAAHNDSVPVVSTKITGMARFNLLKTFTDEEGVDKAFRQEYKNVLKRLDAICHVAASKGVAIFFDAEESWIQDAIDHLVTIMMRRYNREKVVVYNTFQMYRTDRLQYLSDSFNAALKGGYMLGAKLVRGAYMDKERERAERKGYPSPIYPNKEATDDAYNTAMRFCVDNYLQIASCNASHNLESNMLQAELIAQRNLPRNHPHLNFCQLYGMSDNITFNLAHAGYNVAKYVPYGPVREVVPYLIRRAEENSSVTGDMSREYQLVLKEIKRREIG
ncbi:MAG TPA: proline dehydrogenase family protein [Saprospiraceae bacterium]|nr:proline dehydrogenase family protein [Saprospiraceae bacterium]HMQ83112.1 proline dehydrogenase family protein [Saprospiraceae bacterium]